MQNFALRKENKILKSYEFRFVKKNAIFVSLENIKCSFCNNKKSKNPKLGITVPKKFGKAVQRNQFKRFVREAFRHNTYLMKEGLMLNITPKESFKLGVPTFHQIEKDLLVLLKKDKDSNSN